MPDVIEIIETAETVVEIIQFPTVSGMSGLIAATRTALAATATEIGRVWLAESPRQDWFEWRAGNYATLVTADAGQAVYVASSLVGYGSTVGCWVRTTFIDELLAEWAGIAFETNPAVANSALTAWDTQLDHLITLATALLGRKIMLPVGRGRLNAIHNNLTDYVEIVGRGKGRTTIVEGASISLTADLFRNLTVPTGVGTRTNIGIAIRDLTIDGALRVWPKWLQKADGTAITDPAADYVPGTGALASAVSGVAVTPTISGGQVTAGEVTSGGTGLKSHATYPYLATEAPIVFIGGGGSGAWGLAAITGNSLALGVITMKAKGSGYTTTPTARVHGGHADIKLLLDPAVDRRNRNFAPISGSPAIARFQTGTAIQFSKAIRCEVTGVLVKNHLNTAIVDAGCLGNFYDVEFENVGANDGAFFGLWVQSYDAVGGANFTDSEGTRARVKSRNCNRIPCLFAPTKGGDIEFYDSENSKEGGLYLPDKANISGNQIRVINPRIKGVTISDIVAHGIESGRTENILIINPWIEATDDAATSLCGSKNIAVDGGTFVDNFLMVAGAYPFGPFSERYMFGYGSAPLAGLAINIAEEGHVHKTGTQDAIGGKNIVYRGGTYRDSRAEGVMNRIFKALKSGANNLSQGLVIADNDFTGLPLSMRKRKLDMSIGNIYVADEPGIVLRNNRGAEEFLRWLVQANANNVDDGTLQDIFLNEPARWLQPDTLYRFRFLLHMLSGATPVNYSVKLGEAADIPECRYVARVRPGASDTVQVNAEQTTPVTAAALTQIMTSAVFGTRKHVIMEGTLETGANGGLLRPQFQYSGVTGGTVRTEIDSIGECWEIGPAGTIEWGIEA